MFFFLSLIQNTLLYLISYILMKTSKYDKLLLVLYLEIMF